MTEGGATLAVGGMSEVHMARLWVGLILAGAVGGCAVGPNYNTPEARVPANWSGPTRGIKSNQLMRRAARWAWTR